MFRVIAAVFQCAFKMKATELYGTIFVMILILLFCFEEIMNGG